MVTPFSGRLIPAPRLALAALLIGVFAPKAASAVQSAELYRTQAYFYGRFEARIRFAPGEGVVSSFFMWKDGSSSTTSWNELDFEKANATCRLQTNIWTGKGTQSAQTNTPSFDVCSDYHTYAFEWTPDYIAWLIDGTQVRKVTGSSVTEYTQNAAQGMTMHFNTWEGNSSFGGTLDPSTLPVHEYISWAQYSSYTNGAFQLQWREDFNGATTPSGWAAGNWASPYNLSTHNPANVTYAGGVAVLSMTADGATGFTGTPPADSMAGGTGGSQGSSGGGSGTAGAPGSGGSTATGGAPGAGGRSGAGGTTGSGGATAAGGTVGSGGAVGAGGNSATGGVSGEGGATATGGSGSVSTGGTPGAGGSTSTGGTPQAGSSGGCSCRTAPARNGAPSRGNAAALLLVAACLLRRPGRNCDKLERRRQTSV